MLYKNNIYSITHDSTEETEKTGSLSDRKKLVILYTSWEWLGTECKDVVGLLRW